MCNEKVFDESKIVKENAMLKVRPNLFDEWDFEKNMGVDIYKATKGSDRRVWWICKACKSNYMTRIQHKVNGSNCSFCTGQKTNHTNSLVSLRHDIATQWDYRKNGDLTPHDVTVNSNKKVWWLGDCGHEWKATISSRTNGRDCPYCDGKQILVGFNDMWTTNPDLASLLADPKDGYKYTEGSGKRVDWKCLKCRGEIKNKVIYSINKYGLSCPNCSDGFSYPEKIMYHLLKELEKEFEIHKKFRWSNNKIYDFYIPSLNMIIETHGEQHSTGSFSSIGGRTLQQEQENDELKHEIALQNGINEYIEIDCLYSNLEYIKNNILKSKLTNHFELNHIDWDLINSNSCNSFVLKVCDMYNNETKSTVEIANKFNLSLHTIIRYLKRGRDSGLCDYSINHSRNIVSKKLTKKIVQISLDGMLFIDKWNSISEASDYTGVHNSSISACLQGRTKTAGGFKWMYLEDYENQFGKIYNDQQVS